MDRRTPLYLRTLWTAAPGPRPPRAVTAGPSVPCGPGMEKPLSGPFSFILLYLPCLLEALPELFEQPYVVAYGPTGEGLPGQPVELVDDVAKPLFYLQVVAQVVGFYHVAERAQLLHLCSLFFHYCSHFRDKGPP